MPERINLKRGKGCVAHDFRSFSPWSLGPVAFGLVVAQYIIARAHSRSATFASWQPKDKERDRKGLGYQYSLQEHTSNDLTSFH
jgi:hypothetical protein